MNEELRQRIAMFRYGVIGELVNRPLCRGEKEHLLDGIVAKEWRIPGSRRQSIGRSTVRDWIQQYQSHGLEGLKPLPRKDKGCSRGLSDQAQEKLLELREGRPEASIQSLIDTLCLSGGLDPGQRLARSTVYRFLAENGPLTQAGARLPDAQAFTYAHVNDLWMSDVMHGPRLLRPGRSREGAKTYLIAFLDDASRLIPFASFYPSENSACFQDALRQALLRRAMPRRLYCDNGSAFRTHHLQLVCATLNVALIHSRPHQPRGRGKIERFFRHVRSAFLPHLDPEMLSDLESLNRVFWAWVEGYYHLQPHRGLDGQSPLDRFLEDEARLRPAPADLDRLMRMKVLRRVAKDRTVQLQGRLYEAPDGYAGEKVEVLFDPYDPQAPVHLRRENGTEEKRMRILDAIGNARRRRPNAEPGHPAKPRETGISYLELIAKKHFGQENDS